MSVSTTTSLVQYTIASLGQAFTPSFPIQNTSDLVLIYTSAAPNYVDTVLTLSTDYTVTGTFTSGVCTNPTVTLEGSGLHYAVGGQLTIQRLPPETQPTTVLDGTSYKAATLNNAWDWLCYSIQALKDRMDRASFQTAASTALKNPLAFANILGKVAGWDNNGNPTTYYLNTSGISPFPSSLNATFPFFFPGYTSANLATIPTVNAPIPCLAILVSGSAPNYSSSIWYLVASTQAVATGVVKPNDNAALRWIEIG